MNTFSRDDLPNNNSAFLCAERDHLRSRCIVPIMSLLSIVGLFVFAICFAFSGLAGCWSCGVV